MLQGYKRALCWKAWRRAQIVGRSRSCTLLTSTNNLLRPIFHGERIKPFSVFSRQYASSQASGRDDKSGNAFIYRRNPKDNRIPRANVAFCLFHTTYWGWYAERCAEAFLLESGTNSFFLHPTAGLYGLTFAMVLNFACYQYSTLIVSKMAFHKGTGKVRVWFHKLPFLTEAETPIEFELGEIFLDRTKAEVIYLLEKLGGDMTEFRGHLPLMVQSDHFKSRFPLLVYCNDGYVVKDNNTFLEALLFDAAPTESEDWEEENEEHEPEERKATSRGSLSNNLRISGKQARRRGRKRRPRR